MSLGEHYGDPVKEAATGLTLDEQIEDLKVPKEGSIGEHFLDKDPKTQKYFRLIRSWWYYEREKQIDERVERMKAHDYRDGEQWDPDDKEEVEARGQKASVFNLIKPTCDWVVGTEKRTRVDYSVMPRQSDAQPTAEKKTKLLKYLADVNKIGFERSLAFDDATVSGLGWLDHGIRSDETDEPLYVTYEDWRNVWRDSHAKRRDLSDSRYLFRSKVVDYDIAVAMFPDRADCIQASLNQQDSSYLIDEQGLDPEIDALDGPLGEAGIIYTQRDRVRLVSCEYTIPTAVKVLRGDDLGTLNGTIYNEQNEGMAYLVNGGHASLYDAIRMTCWQMIFTGNYVLQNSQRPYTHQRFSLVPVWGYIRKRDNRPYGLVKNLMDPQDDLNKRRSKALFILSTKQAIVEEDAVDDLDDFIDEKDRPDGVMRVRRMEGVELIHDNVLAAEHISLMEQDARYIEQVGGVTKENRGMETNATSGKAIEARQQQGHVNTAELFDNYRLAFQLSGEIQLSLIEQYYTDEKIFRITGDAKKPDFTEVNTGLPEDDITAHQADFVVEADSYHATIRQAMAENLWDLLTKMPPEISIKLLDIAVDLSDLPQRQAIVERIRSINGMLDPDADMEDPQVRAEIEERLRAADLEKSVREELMKLEVALKEAEINEKNAEAAKDKADARKKIADIRKDMEELKVKKAAVLEKIEARESVGKKHSEPRPATSLTG
jgi:hypothetical protein